MTLCASWPMTYAADVVQDVTFFQSPTQEAIFDYADVFLMQDKAYAQKQGTYRNDDWKRTELVLNHLVDNEGRFSVWKFIPPYIEQKAENKKRLIAEIWFYNEPIAIDSTMQPINEDGNYLIPYNVRYKYNLSLSDGTVLYQKDYGSIHSAFLTQNVNLDDEFPVDSRMGIQAVFTRVRQEVYALYGFSSFEMPFALHPFDQLPGLPILHNQVIDAMLNKEEMMLNDEQKGLLTAYTNVLQFQLPTLDAAQLPYAHRNLALCKAWLGDTLAVSHLDKYQQSLKSHADSTDFYNIDLFVRYYPLSVQRHGALLRMLSGSLAWKVDAMTYNDLLCNVYELEYPIAFLPVTPLKGKVKELSGTVTQAGKEPIEYTLTYDKKNRPKTLEMNRVEFEDKQKHSVKINPLHIGYQKGKYHRITCSPNDFIRILMPGVDNFDKPVDKKEQVLYCKTDNVLGGFVKLKVSTEETNRYTFGADGTMYIRGEKSLSRPHQALKKIADSQGEKFPSMVSANSSVYTIEVKWDENDFLTQYAWKGYVLMEKNEGYDNYAYIKADSVVVNMDMPQPIDSKGKSSVDYSVKLQLENKLTPEKRSILSSNKKVADSSLTEVKPFEYADTQSWPFEVKYDEKGNWTYLHVGPYEVSRTIIYQ